MAKDYASRPRSEVRRHDRAVEDNAWIASMLHRSPTGALATVRDGQPFINTNLFVYDEAAHFIYMHTAQVGRTRSNIEADPRVCFSAMQIGRLLPAPTAFGFSVEYSGVTVFGTATIVTDISETRHALEMLVAKYAPHLKLGRDYSPPADAELARTTVYRISIEEWSGKKKEAEPDFPGAFRYGDHAPEESEPAV